jgi:hypothetical protein
MKTTDETTDAASLVAQAQAAYEQKRTKECVTLIRQVLASDPSNRDAQALQAAVQSDIERDVVDARSLLRDSQKDDGSGVKYRKAAEIILLKILYLDPDHAEAKSLLGNARGSADTHSVQASTAAQQPAPFEKAARGEELMFTAAPVPFERQIAKKPSGLAGKMPILVVAALILTVGIVLLFGFWSKKSTATAEDTTTKSTPAPVAERPKPAVVSASAPSKPAPPVTATASAEATTSAVASPVTPPAAPAKGSLAVTSSTFAEIYMGGKLLGETPTTLQLNTGKQTLEYRHGNLKTTMIHDIKANQTTTALVTFEIDVQINARPWANVFVEGATRKALGQTPFGSVRVPLGSVLTFENPNFPSKTYRVTDKDSAIQIVFP